jgi:hypothetical protein
LKQFATGQQQLIESEAESSIAKRAKDAIRELRSAKQFEISKCAGLTDFEAEIALLDLKRLGVVQEHKGAYSLR